MSTYQLQLQYEPSLETCEDAIVAVLQADPTIAAYVSQVSSFAGTWEEARRDLIRTLPGIVVVYVGGRTEARGAAGAVHKAEWHVVVASRNLRSERRGRQTDSAEVGAYQMIEDVTRVLGRADLGVDGMGGLEPRETHPVRLKGKGNVSQGMAVYNLIFTCSLDLVAKAAPDDLSTIASTFLAANPDESDGSTDWVSAAAETTTSLESP